MQISEMMRVLLSVVLAVTVAQETCHLVNNVIIGEDSISMESAPSAAVCCTKCNQNPDCIAFTFVVNGGICYLKDNLKGNVSQTDRISGTNGRQPSVFQDACTIPGLTQFPFCDKKLSLEARLDDLVARIELNETGHLLTARQSIAIPRYDTITRDR